MRTFYIFKVKEEYATLTKNNPYQLFRMLEFIYNLDKQEVEEGADLFYKMIEKLNNKKLDIQIFKKYHEDYFYMKFKNIHQVNNVYKKEASKLILKNHYLILESTTIKPSFLEDLETVPNLFLCDFENKDYFWLEKLPV